MNSVRHFPVAEQYPSITATVSASASKRISGMRSGSQKNVGQRGVLTRRPTKARRGGRREEGV